MRATPIERTTLNPIVLVSAAFWALTSIMPVTAKPLDAEGCLKLNAEIKVLDEQGIRDIAEKGPSATKSMATREQLDKVRVYLATLGQLRFRCPQEAPLVALKPEPAEDPAEAGAATAPIDANAAGITLPPGVAAAIVAPIVPKKPAAPKVAAPRAAPPQAAPGAAAPKPAPSERKAPAKAPAPVPATVPEPTVVAPPPKPKLKSKNDDAFRPGGSEPKPPAVPQ
jgi:hypothetical protein